MGVVDESKVEYKKFDNKAKIEEIIRDLHEFNRNVELARERHNRNQRRLFYIGCGIFISAIIFLIMTIALQKWRALTCVIAYMLSSILVIVANIKGFKHK